MQSAQLKDIRRADPHGQGRHSFTAQQQTLRRLNVVFAAFYARAKKGKAGYPRFKPYRRFHQVGFAAGDGAKWAPADVGGWARAAFQAVGSVKVRQHRPVPGTVKFLRLKREHRRWYVIVITDTSPAPLPAGGRAVGVDVGVARFLTTSDGQIIANPRFLAASAETITRLQGRKERARRGSGNRKRLRRALAREWQGPQPAPRLPPQGRPRPGGLMRRHRPGKAQHRRDDPQTRAEARPGPRRGLPAEHGRRESRAQQGDP
jgi:putative transposase